MSAGSVHAHVRGRDEAAAVRGLVDFGVGLARAKQLVHAFAEFAPGRRGRVRATGSAQARDTLPADRFRARVQEARLGRRSGGRAPGHRWQCRRPTLGQSCGRVNTPNGRFCSVKSARGALADVTQLAGVGIVGTIERRPAAGSALPLTPRARGHCRSATGSSNEQEPKLGRTRVRASARSLARDSHGPEARTVAVERERRGVTLVEHDSVSISTSFSVAAGLDARARQRRRHQHVQEPVLQRRRGRRSRRRAGARRGSRGADPPSPSSGRRPGRTTR